LVCIAGCWNSSLQAKEQFFFKYFLGDFFFLFVQYSALLHLPPSDSTVPTDAGIEPKNNCWLTRIFGAQFGGKDRSFGLTNSDPNKLED
jgi:hypothetical protein